MPPRILFRQHARPCADSPSLLSLAMVSSVDRRRPGPRGQPRAEVRGGAACADLPPTAFIVAVAVPAMTAVRAAVPSRLGRDRFFYA